MIMLNPDGISIKGCNYAPKGRRRGVAYLYVVTRMSTGQTYVGITVDARKRWNTHRWLANSGQSNQLLHRAMAKYGLDAFICETVACARTWDAGVIAEQQLIKQTDSHVSRGGYNLTEGGEGPIGRQCSPETRARISAAKIGRRGRKITEHEREAARKRLADRWTINPEQFNGIARQGGMAQLGRKNTAETKAKMRDSALRIWAERRQASVQQPH